jgi:hypothetical protein
MCLRLNIRKAMLTPKVDKTEMSGRSNRSFRFLHIRPMFQLLADVAIQGSRSHLQRPSYVVGIGKRKFHATTLFTPFTHPMPKSWGPSPMMFHHYAPWFGWYAPPVQYKLFYPRSAKHEPNAFHRSAHSRKDRFYPKSRLNAAKTQEQPNRTFWFGNMEVPVFLAQVGYT